MSHAIARAVRHGDASEEREVGGGRSVQQSELHLAIRHRQCGGDVSLERGEAGGDRGIGGGLLEAALATPSVITPPFIPPIIPLATSITAAVRRRAVDEIRHLERRQCLWLC